MRLQDPNHVAARNAWSRIHRNHKQLFSTNYIITETIALLQKRHGPRPVASFLQNVVPLVELYFVERRLHDAALELLTMSDRRRLSFVDCSSFLFMRHARIRQAFAYDDHFKAFGFELV